MSTMECLLAILALSTFTLHGLVVNGGAEVPKSPALFVFGDSYADTGSHDPHNPSLFASWRPPYGSSWPGRPAGRFSDGKVLTDFVASFLDLPSPSPYREGTGFQPCNITSGINFAFGGSGLFYTFGPQYPTIARQITQFQQVLKCGQYTRGFLASSLVLVVVAGNDYFAYLMKRPERESQGILSLVPEVVDQIAVAIDKLYKFGFRKFVVANMEPTDCLPLFAKNFSSCVDSKNKLSSLHNMLITRQVSKLQELAGVQITILDQYRGFLSALRNFGSNPLEPCCKGIGQSKCGSVDSGGRPLYTVCSNPEKAFFWDDAHPTEAGWKAVSEAYRPLLKRTDTNYTILLALPMAGLVSGLLFLARKNRRRFCSMKMNWFGV